jgi:hypothetical protein
MAGCRAERRGGAWPGPGWWTAQQAQRRRRVLLLRTRACRQSRQLYSCMLVQASMRSSKAAVRWRDAR